MAVATAGMTKQRINRVAKVVRRMPLIPSLIILVFILVALLAPLIAPHSATQGSLSEKYIPPMWAKGGNSDYVLGTDKLGRDILSRLIWGARISLQVSLFSVLAGGVIGSVLGLVAGYWGGWADAVIMRAADVALALPGIILAFVLAMVLGPSFTNVIIIVGFLLWARYARQARGEVLSIKEKDYVTLARAAGCSDLRIIIWHIFPNVVNTLVVLATLQIGWVIILESSLSFLGVGLPPPQPAWGSMVAEGRGLIATAWWVSLFPGLAIAVTVLALNLFGDWLRDAIDPKLRQV